jgi:fibro-slime domain-containing protein
MKRLALAVGFEGLFLGAGCGNGGASGFQAAQPSGTSDGAPLTEGASEGGPLPGGGDGSVPIFMSGDGGRPGVIGDGAVVLPDNFVPTELGGYALGPPLTGSGSDAGVVQNSGSANCSLITGVVRDFKNQPDDSNTGHPDFDTFNGSSPTPGLMKSQLGSDTKPVYAGVCDSAAYSTVLLPIIPTTGCPNGQELTTQPNFDQWYRYAPGVNYPFIVYLKFVPNMGVYTFDSELYFPLDGVGWGNNATGEDNKLHNFGFTTELHLKFTYKGGETFTFKGDDDVWAFIAGEVAVDRGGLHPAAMGAVSLYTLGLMKGTEYPLDLFNAERHPTGSHFRVDTNLSFTSCGIVPPDVPQ